MSTPVLEPDPSASTKHPWQLIQYNHQYIYQGLAPVSAGPRRPPRRVAADELRRLDRLFTPPPGFGDARTRLADRRIVLLDGARGCGRDAAARILLHELGGRARVEPLSEEEPGTLLTDVTNNDRILLDLSEIEYQRWTGVQAEFSAFQERLREQDAHAVAILPLAGSISLHPELRPLVVSLERPPAEVVLLRHLRVDAFNPDDVGGLPADVREFLRKQRSMQEIARLADLIVRARARNRDDITEFCGRALKAMQPQAAEISRALTTLESGAQKAFLLTTAMLHGAHLHEIQQATKILLQEVSHPHDESPVLDRRDWSERVNAIRATVDADRRVTFDDLDYDEAIRRYLSLYLPEVHRVLPNWFTKTYRQQDLSEDDRDNLAIRFAKQFLRTGVPSDPFVLDSLIVSLAKTATNAGVRVAHLILVEGLGSDAHGGHFRRQILTWAKDASLSAGLAAVLNSVCGDVLCIEHPHQAAVRLHHLARHGTTTTAAAETLLRLVREDDRLPVYLLNRLAETFRRRQPDDRRWQADLRLFLGLAEPALFIGGRSEGGAQRNDPVVAQRLADCWNAAYLDTTLVAETSDQLCAWLLAAGRDDASRDSILTVLVAGCAGRPKLLGWLFRTASQWRDGADPDDMPGRRDLVETLMKKIFSAVAV